LRKRGGCDDYKELQRQDGSFREGYQEGGPEGFFPIRYGRHCKQEEQHSRIQNQHQEMNG
jgi:hypothetical protein